MRFSQRQGYRLAQKAIQLESIDGDLCAGLWNAVQYHFLDDAKIHSHHTTSSAKIYGQIKFLWRDYFKLPVDTIPYKFKDTVLKVREYFFNSKWYDTYDILEFIDGCSLSPTRYRNFCNAVLEKENSGYRFVDGLITPITSEVELMSVEDAISSSNIFSGVSIHIKTALEHLSDRKNPDYRNSVKESICAIESLCKLLTGNHKATLGETLAILEKNKMLHKSLKVSFSALYGYTNDQGGIRHALLEESKLTFTDAKYMLVTCSAFTNYMIGKVGDLDYEIPKKP